MLAKYVYPLRVKILSYIVQLVGVNLETVTDITSTDFPGHYPHEDHAWDVQKFEDNLQIKFNKNEHKLSQFSLIGVDASVANAFRRIMIAEIPSLAIEYCFINNNTSIIQDEVLAARLGLVPFKTDSRAILDWLKWFPKLGTEDSDKEKETDHPDRFNNCLDENTIHLQLKIECTRNKDAARGEKDPKKIYNNAHVYAKDIEFKPYGRQVEIFADGREIKPTNPEILVAKLRPGQVIDIDMHAIKGIGRDHTKFSPVATASYRLMPVINITKPIVGKDAKKFQECFPNGVIGLQPLSEEEVQQGVGKTGENKAVVIDAMKDTVSRECLRHAEFKDKVKLGRIRDHFIFQIESVGQWESDDLFLESIKILKAKAERFGKEVRNRTSS